MRARLVLTAAPLLTAGAILGWLAPSGRWDDALAQEKKADAIGMSGLLVKSVGVMKENLEELNAKNVKTPVLLGMPELPAMPAATATPGK